MSLLQMVVRANLQSMSLQPIDCVPHGSPEFYLERDLVTVIPMLFATIPYKDWERLYSWLTKEVCRFSCAEYLENRHYAGRQLYEWALLVREDVGTCVVKHALKHYYTTHQYSVHACSTQRLWEHVLGTVPVGDMDYGWTNEVGSMKMILDELKLRDQSDVFPLYQPGMPVIEYSELRAIRHSLLFDADEFTGTSATTVSLVYDFLKRVSHTPSYCTTVFPESIASRVGFLIEKKEKFLKCITVFVSNGGFCTRDMALKSLTATLLLAMLNWDQSPTYAFVSAMGGAYFLPETPTPCPPVRNVLLVEYVRSAAIDSRIWYDSWLLIELCLCLPDIPTEVLSKVCVTNRILGESSNPVSYVRDMVIPGGFPEVTDSQKLFAVDRGVLKPVPDRCTKRVFYIFIRADCLGFLQSRVRLSDLRVRITRVAPSMFVSMGHYCELAEVEMCQTPTRRIGKAIPPGYAVLKIDLRQYADSFGPYWFTMYTAYGLEELACAYLDGCHQGPVNLVSDLAHLVSSPVTGREIPRKAVLTKPKWDRTVEEKNFFERFSLVLGPTIISLEDMFRRSTNRSLWPVIVAQDSGQSKLESVQVEPSYPGYVIRPYGSVTLSIAHMMSVHSAYFTMDCTD
jgi:hypothetical protein